MCCVFWKQQMSWWWFVWRIYFQFGYAFLTVHEPDRHITEFSCTNWNTQVSLIRFFNKEKLLTKRRKLKQNFQDVFVHSFLEFSDAKAVRHSLVNTSFTLFYIGEWKSAYCLWQQWQKSSLYFKKLMQMCKERRRSQRRKGAMPPPKTFSSISCQFVFREVVSQTTAPPLKSKHVAPFNMLGWLRCWQGVGFHCYN